MQLSKNFTLEELIKSQTATRLCMDNTPSFEYECNLKALAISILQEVRDAFKKPVIVSSGYRCPMLNRVIGGSPFSKHIKGMAADISVVGVPHPTVCDFIKEELTFGQLILEGHQNKKNGGWVHVSLYDDLAKKNNECLAAFFKHGKTTYQKVDTSFTEFIHDLEFGGE